MAAGVLDDLGPCSLTYNSVDIGAPFGNVLFNFSDENRSIHEAKHGTTPVDAVRVGRAVVVEAELTRLQIATLGTLVPGASVSSVTGKMTVRSQVGGSLYASAYELIIKPLENGVASATATKWIHVKKCIPRPDFSIVYGNEEGDQRRFKVFFDAFPDATTNILWTIGY